MSTINYAIEITTSATTLTDTDYGCVNGVFRFITGRPSFDGIAPHPTGEAGIGASVLQAVWYEGWIRDDSIGNPNRSIDIDVSGSYGTLSGFKFSLIDGKETTRFWKFCRDNDIYFVNRNIQIYVVVDSVFYYGWNGVVVNSPHNEIDHTFQCKDAFRSIHKPMPPSMTEQSSYEDQSSADGVNESAKTVPIVIGDVSYSKLIPETSDVTYTTLVSWWFLPEGKSMFGDRTGVVINANHPHYQQVYFDLCTWPPELTGEYGPKVTFTEDQFGDGTYYLRIAKATDLEGSDVDDVDKDYMIRIIGNDATVVGAHISGSEGVFNMTRLYLSKGIRNGTEQNMEAYDYKLNLAPNYYGMIGVRENTWLFNIVHCSLKYYISEEAVSSIQAAEGTGLPAIYIYNKDTEEYEDVSYLVSDYELTPATGRPYILLNRDSMSIEGDMKITCYYKPAQVYWTKNQGVPEDITTTVTDRSRATYKTDTLGANAGGGYMGDAINVNIKVPDALLKLDCDNIWLAPDITTAIVPAGKMTMLINPMPTWPGIFILPATSDDSYNYYPFSGGCTGFDLTCIPDEYYGMGGNLDGLTSKYDKYEAIGGEDVRVVDSVKLEQFVIDAVRDGTSTPWINMRLFVTQPTTVKMREISFVVDRTIKLTNEPIYVRLTGEPVSDDGSGSGVDSSNVYNAFRLMLENYDGLTSSEIDYGNLYDARHGWHCGRTLDRRRSSYDYLKELCEQSFVCLFATRAGKRKLTAWRENTTSVATHTQANIIRGTLGDYELSPIEKLYNEFQIAYAYDPGVADYTRWLTIYNIDQNSFPAIGEDWTAYVGGMPTTFRADCKALWDICHESYVRAQVVSAELPTQVKELDWYTDVSIFDPDAVQYLGTDSSSWKFLVNLVEWVTRQKETIGYSIPMSAANIQLELLDPITFSDTVYTAGETRTGWITKLELDCKKQRINIDLTLDPWDIITMDDGIIVERGSILNTDTITERGNQGDDTITEVGV